jgi:hypothetical protein
MVGRLAGVWLSLGAQVTVQVPLPGSIAPAGTAEYGEATQVPLTSLAFDGESHQRHHVITRARLDVLEMGRYYLLTDGNARVLVLLGKGIRSSDLTAFLGRDVEARGIVRLIHSKEYVGPFDVDVVDDQTLPPLPAPRDDLPKVSLTLLGLSDVTGGAAPVAEGRIVVVGQFRGRNLYGDLPAGTQRKPGDWVLKDGQQAWWVTGREPKGKGWALDPDYRADTARWLEVEGRPEVANGVMYLQASAVRLVKPPPDTSSAGPRQP